jgi:hypothetical protein
MRVLNASQVQRKQSLDAELLGWKVSYDRVCKESLRKERNTPSPSLGGLWRGRVGCHWVLLGFVRGVDGC